MKLFDYKGEEILSEMDKNFNSTMKLLYSDLVKDVFKPNPFGSFISCLVDQYGRTIPHSEELKISGLSAWLPAEKE